jgi:hypothetical protein
MPDLKAISFVAALISVSLLAPIRPALADVPSSGAAGHTVSEAARSHAELLTTGLVQLNMQYQTASPGRKGRLEQDLKAAARTRKQKLLRLMEEDAGEFLRVAIPSAIRAGLPLSVQADVEEETDIEGTLEIEHEDGFNYSRFNYRLKTAIDKLTLHFANHEGPEDLVTGARVRVKGMRLGSALAADGSSTGSVEALVTVTPNTLGVQKTLVILVNFADKATQPYTVDAVTTMTFGSVNNYFKANSYGQTSLLGHVAGWYTIALSSTVCDPAGLRSKALQAATAAGINVSAYNRRIFAFPRNACAWAGLGSVGGNPSYALMNGSYSLRTVAHEVGHNFGLYHSRSLDCGTGVTGTSCTIAEYGDVFDVLGASPSGHFNAFQKERLGWLDYGVSPPLTTVTGSGTYSIGALEPLGSQSRALKLLKSTDSMGRSTYYYMEYRQGVPGGVIFHTGTNGIANSSNLLDMTPETLSWSDSPLAIGTSFHDTELGLIVSPLSGDGARASVNVTLGPVSCVRSSPTMTMAPSQSLWQTPGGTVTFTARLTNNDNAGCAPTTFSMRAFVPVGWTAAFSNPAPSVAPGTSVSTSVSVKSATTAIDGFYTVTANASDTNGRAVAARATYVVNASIETSVWTDQPSYSGLQTITISTSVRAGGAAVAGAGLSVAVTFPTVGQKTKVTTVTTTTNASGVGVVTLRLKKGSPKGTYPVQSTASVNSSLISRATTSFIVR